MKRSAGAVWPVQCQCPLRGHTLGLMARVLRSAVGLRHRGRVCPSKRLHEATFRMCFIPCRMGPWARAPLKGHRWYVLPGHGKSGTAAGG